MVGPPNDHIPGGQLVFGNKLFKRSTTVDFTILINRHIIALPPCDCQMESVIGKLIPSIDGPYPARVAGSDVHEQLSISHPDGDPASIDLICLTSTGQDVASLEWFNHLVF